MYIKMGGATDMKLQECYEKLNGDYNDALSRMMNDTLIERFLFKFLDDGTMGQMRTAAAAGDTEATFLAAHTMKGIAGNLGFSELTRASSVLTEKLRGKTNAEEHVDGSSIAEVENAYNAVASAIESYRTEKG